MRILPVVAEDRIPAVRQARLPAVAFLVVCLAASFAGCCNRPRVTHRDVVVRSLPPEMDGIKLVQISDLHYDDVKRETPAFYAKVAELVNAQKPDIIVITGDSVDIAENYLKCADFMARLEAKYGKFAVPGNHEHYTGVFDWPPFKEALQDAGVTYLVNENAPVAICGKTLWIAGTDDPFRGYVRLDWALAGIPDGEAVIVLAHSPDILPYAVVMRVSLVLVGHTHGGQLRLPLIGPVYAMTPTMSKFAAGMYRRDQTHFQPSDMRNSLKYSAGMFHDDQTQMYVNSGIGLDATYPHRLMCRPEITVFTLRSPGPSAETANAQTLNRKG